MELLYVVKFTIHSDTVDPYQEALHSISNWLSDDSHSPTLEGLPENTPTTIDVAPARTRNSQFARTASATALEVQGDKGVLVDIRQQASSDTVLSTRITLTQTNEDVALRVGIGYESRSNLIKPRTRPSVYQPRLVRMLADNDHLTLRHGAQAVSARYDLVRDSGATSKLVNELHTTERLPVVIIHTQSERAWQAAKRTSTSLIGLTHAVAVNYRTAQFLSESIGGLTIPFGGASVVWPTNPLTFEQFTAEDIRDEHFKTFIGGLASRLGGLASLGLGRDSEWRQLKSRDARARRTALQAEVESAKRGSDNERELAALRTQNKSLAEDYDDLLGEYENALEQIESLEAIPNELEIARTEVAYWRNLAQNRTASDNAPCATDPWETIPPLETNVDPGDTFAALSDASNDRITFTTKARNHWRKAGYVDSTEMTRQLTLLSQAAVAFFEGSTQIDAPLDDRMANSYGLTVALSDKSISKFGKKTFKWITDFEYDGNHYDATPHVKVRDGVSWNECGRIHFAIDHENQRFIVQHVAQKGLFTIEGVVGV